MKSVHTISAIILLLTVTTESIGQSQAVNDDILKIDVTKSYSPKKELILQDFMDVEYIPLETNDIFVNQGIVCAIGKDIILVRNKIRDGNIFVYDRTGKAIRKINRKGYGGEEYSDILGILLDEDKGEMYVNDINKKKIFVYDLKGKFKRSFKHKESSKYSFYTDIFNYDRDNLICYEESNEKIAFLLISKQDGSITKEIEIPFKKKKSTEMTVQVSDGDNRTTTYSAAEYYHKILPYNDNWLLLELSSDTVYTFLPDYSLRPFLARTPSIQSMDPEIFLILRSVTDRYYFMEIVKKVYDFKTRTGFPRTSFMYDKQEDAFFEYTFYNGDYSIKKETNLGSRPLEPFELIESYEKGELKGKLKEIAATLDEDDNPVIMLVKRKK
jgi:hypothetical protein